eukprot:512519-Prorocentrum_minimum.AAC.1
MAQRSQGAEKGRGVVPRLNFSNLSQQNNSLSGASAVRPVSPGRIRPNKVSQGGVPVASNHLNPKPTSHGFTPTSTTEYNPHDAESANSGSKPPRVPFSQSWFERILTTPRLGAPQQSGGLSRDFEPMLRTLKKMEWVPPGGLSAEH